MKCVHTGMLMELLGTPSDTCLLFRARPKLQWAESGWIYFFGICL